ncbi:hypothetical protein RRG08_024240 [Elysia crispata]|uniref:Uncharacterized protein n=1 Tax=Elysia crispata TaxID=231223 RepID=A0AAE1D8M5_9GAST|nr:hypothetical protein RRG08_024240 [Elysia crispata]
MTPPWIRSRDFSGKRCYWPARLLRIATRRVRCVKVRKACRSYIALVGLVAAVCLYLLVANLTSPTLSLRSFRNKPDAKSRCFYAQKDEESPSIKENLLKNITFHLDDGSIAYRNKWVGFRGMEQVNCPMALAAPTLNRIYPRQINRTFTHEIMKDAQNCSYFVNKYGFGRYPRPVQMEEDFPIAFVILFHKDLDQVLFLLRAIYRPHNAYCLTVDTKSSVKLHAATRAIVRCLPNVFLSSKLEDIVYGGLSRLMADLNCFKDLMNHPVKWKYILNTPGQQFPLRTNLELVQILKLFAGTNDILGTAEADWERKRHRYVHQYVTNVTTGQLEVRPTKRRHRPLPFGMKAVKCSAYGAFSRQFVHFVLTNQLAKDVLEWSKSIYSPDEMYWGVLNYNRVDPAPGGFSGKPNENPWLSSFSEWEASQGGKLRCRSKFVRGICIFSPADLPVLVKKVYLFANKFHITHHPAALHCLDQWIYNNSVSLSFINETMYLDILKKRWKRRNSILQNL